MYDVEKSRVAKFLSQQVVFLTGVTSGVGMVRGLWDLGIKTLLCSPRAVFTVEKHSRPLVLDRIVTCEEFVQMLLYKILMCRPSRVFVLLRPKDRISAEQRFKELIKNDIFDSLPREVIERVLVVEGDITKPLLELNIRDLIELRSCATVSSVSSTIKLREPSF